MYTLYFIYKYHKVNNIIKYLKHFWVQLTLVLVIFYELHKSIPWKTWSCSLLCNDVVIFNAGCVLWILRMMLSENYILKVKKIVASLKYTQLLSKHFCKYQELSSLRFQSLWKKNTIILVRKVSTPIPGNIIRSSTVYLHRKTETEMATSLTRNLVGQSTRNCNLRIVMFIVLTWFMFMLE